MTLVKIEISNDIAIIRLNNGVTNPINTKLCYDLINALNKVKQTSPLQGLILTSASTKFFSIGFDIPTLIKQDRYGIAEFYQAFNDLCEILFTMPIYTLSAITGHYVAGGSLISASTDSRIVVEGRAKTGITAIKLGLAVPLLGQLIVRLRMKAEYADEFLTTGDFYEIPWAHESGYIDKLSSQEDLLDDAIKEIINNEASQLSDYKHKKELMTRPIIDEYKKNLEHDRIKFVNSWFDPKVQQALYEAMEKF
jgi:enoyl-CoA hydratase/carnithine racemase